MEAVGKNLVHHAARQPVGGLEAFPVGGQLPAAVAAELVAAIHPAHIFLAAVPGIALEVVEKQTGVRRRVVAFPIFGVFAVHAAPEHGVVRFFRCGIVNHAEIHGGAMQVPADGNFEMDRCAFLHCSQRVPVHRVPRLKHKQKTSLFKQAGPAHNITEERAFRPTKLETFGFTEPGFCALRGRGV